MAAWLAAAVAAVAVASWGVALVGRSVTDSRPAPLSAAEVQERLELAGGPVTTAGEAPSPSSGATPSDATAGGPSGAIAPGPAAPGSAAPTGGAAPATTAPAPPATATPPVSAAPPAAVGSASAGETRTYQVVGGTVSLRFEPSGVSVVFANPAQGFEVEQEPEHGNGVRVEFEGEDHRSRVTGWWDGGPQDQVDEQTDDD